MTYQHQALILDFAIDIVRILMAPNSVTLLINIRRVFVSLWFDDQVGVVMDIFNPSISVNYVPSGFGTNPRTLG